MIGAPNPPLEYVPQYISATPGINNVEVFDFSESEGFFTSITTRAHQMQNGYSTFAFVKVQQQYGKTITLSSDG